MQCSFHIRSLDGSTDTSTGRLKQCFGGRFDGQDKKSIECDTVRHHIYILSFLRQREQIHHTQEHTESANLRKNFNQKSSGIATWIAELIPD